MRVVRVLAVLLLLFSVGGVVWASDQAETELVTIEILSEKLLVYDPGRTDNFVIVGRLSVSEEASYSLDELEVRLASPVSSLASVPVDNTGYFSLEITDYYLRSSTYGLNREYTVEVVTNDNTVVGTAVALQIVLVNDYSADSEIRVGETVTVRGRLLDADGDTYPQADVQIVHAGGHTLSKWKDTILTDGYYRIEEVKPYLAGQYYLKVTIYGRSLHEPYPLFRVLPSSLDVYSSCDELALGREADNFVVTVDDNLSKYQKHRWTITGDGFELPAELNDTVRLDLSTKHSNTYTKAVIEQYSPTLDLSGLKPIAGSKLTVTAAVDWLYSDSGQDVFNYQGSVEIPLSPPSSNLEVWGVPAVAHANSLVYLEPTVVIWSPESERFLRPGGVEVSLQGAGIDKRFLLSENISFVPRQSGTITVQFRVWDENGQYRGVVEHKIAVLGGQNDSDAVAELSISATPSHSFTTADRVELNISVAGPAPIIRICVNGELVLHEHAQQVELQRFEVPLKVGVNRFVVTAVDEAYNTGSYTVVVTRRIPSSLRFVPGSSTISADNGTRSVILPPAYVTTSGVPMVPLRATAEYFGCTVGYNSSEEYAWIRCGTRFSTFAPGHTSATIAGESFTLSCSPAIVGEVMYVPASALAEAVKLTLNCTADFIELKETDTK